MSAFQKVRGSSWTEIELEQELQEVVAFTELEKDLEGSSSYAECFKSTDLRRTLLGVMIMTGQQFMGIAFISGYVLYRINDLDHS